MFFHDNQFWLGAWAIIAIALCVFVSTMVNYSLGQDRIVADMVNNGTNPVAANCAIHDSMGNNPTCVLYLSRE